MILKFHSEAPIVKGYNRSCIYDLSRHTYDFVPNDVVDKIKSFEDRKSSEFGNELDDNEKQWLAFMEAKEYCFYVPATLADRFPDLETAWDNASLLTNAIVDVKGFNQKFDFSFLERANCKHILIRFMEVDDYCEVIRFLENKITGLTFKSVDVHVFTKNNITDDGVLSFKEKMIESVPQVISLSVYNESGDPKEMFNRPSFITCTINTYFEALNHNLYYNRKIYIDASGIIKQGVEFEEPITTIGNVKTSADFKQTISQKSFTELWNANKDKTDVCKDCEFRYMCVDSRIPIKRPDDSFYFEKECAYNPYISKWQDDKDFMPLSAIGVSSGSQGFNVDKHTLDQINSEIWDNQ